MGDKYTPAQGDRVRVVLEGEVNDAQRTYFTLTNPDGQGLVNLVVPASVHTVSVEKVQPPVEQFGAGDVVLERDTQEIRALGSEGYIHLGYVNRTRLAGGRFYRYGEAYGYDLSVFTSGRFEKVSLG